MSDPILAELQEDYRREQFKQWMNRYGGLVLTLAVLLVAATAAYSLWQQHRQGQQQAVTSELYQAVGPESKQQPEVAAEKVTEFAKGHAGTSQADLANMMAAGLDQQAGQPQTAMENFKKVADSATADKSLKGTATILYVQTGLTANAVPADMQAMLAPYQAGDSPFRFTAWELGALAAHQDGNHDKAQGFLDQLIKDGDTPEAMRQRATELQRVL